MRHRGNIIIKNDDKWLKIYLAYNANPDYLEPFLNDHPKFIESIKFAKNGISTVEEREYEDGIKHNTARPYHDHRDFDNFKEPCEEYDSLEEAIGAVVWEYAFIFQDGKWETKKVELASEKLIRERPKRVNVWRKLRDDKEKAKNGVSVDESPDVGSNPVHMD